MECYKEEVSNTLERLETIADMLEFIDDFDELSSSQGLYLTDTIEEVRLIMGKLRVGVLMGQRRRFETVQSRLVGPEEALYLKKKVYEAHNMYDQGVINSLDDFYIVQYRDRYENGKKRWMTLDSAKTLLKKYDMYNLEEENLDE